MRRMRIKVLIWMKRCKSKCMGLVVEEAMGQNVFYMCLVLFLCSQFSVYAIM